MAFCAELAELIEQDPDIPLVALQAALPAADGVPCSTSGTDALLRRHGYTYKRIYTLIFLVSEFWRVDLWAENASGRCLIRPCLVSSTERLEIEACVGSQREGHGVARRANAILLLDDGKSCQWIAEFPYLADDTLRGWHRSWRESGWEALAVDGWKVASLVLPLLRMRLYAPGFMHLAGRTFLPLDG